MRGDDKDQRRVRDEIEDSFRAEEVGGVRSLEDLELVQSSVFISHSVRLHDVRKSQTFVLV